jgi:hypothetical protein
VFDLVVASQQDNTSKWAAMTSLARAEAIAYKPSLTGVSFVAWAKEGGEEETLESQFWLNTHGATPPSTSRVSMLTKGVPKKDGAERWYLRCPLCISDICTSQEDRCDAGGFSRSGLVNLAQHACGRAHQCSKLAYFRGVRDALKQVAQARHDVSAEEAANFSIGHAYVCVVRTCQWMERALREDIKHSPDDAPKVVDEGGPTPSTTKSLGRMVVDG